MQLQSVLSQFAGCHQIPYPKDAPGAHRKPRRIKGETALQLQFNWEIAACLNRFHAPGTDREPRRQRVSHGRRGRRVCARVQPLQPRLPRRCQGGRIDALHQPPVPHAGQQLRRRGVLGCWREINGFSLSCRVPGSSCTAWHATLSPSRNASSRSRQCCSAGYEVTKNACAAH